ncbi:hypothetical protein MMIC_P1918 [Mariprofundus micogutta]|uniref:Uncharacterized protein n=1 Tax=Mariprofundus micogutta TaxID=1921010 RepID=A0A1L8CPT8_9PROT|nr:TorF family putative porin [Mariprofundus micogutta]GAV20940.1 hypothetical protein MMIC_P1918 [Mariprofundus micogutta]
MELKKKYLPMMMAAGLMTTGLATTAAQAEGMSVGGDVGVFSQYMWRGMQASSTASVQGDLGVDAGNGLSANVWFAAPLGNSATGGNTTEFDFTIDYSGEVGDLSYSLGFIYYAYLNGASANTGEAYAGVGYGPLSVTYYNAVLANAGGWQKDAYVDVALGHSMGGFDFGANFGFYLPSTDVANPTAFPTTKKELGHVDLSLSKDVTVGDVTMTPSLMVSIPTYTGKPKNANQFVAGVNFAY